ncbi:hypothetical protein HCTV5_28 [Halovirus HCTV-5]|uniref:hypothetical protein n=1 Tax=Halovirus HCTV-5 TaxID=1273748 RepID=UPI0003348712|nr:hypothetical protein M200_gp028 [Halovirus HCTV-5]AGM11638.1 hypothetical protein HCTV5_28 [Halovirus HCTV-5]
MSESENADEEQAQGETQTTDSRHWLTNDGLAYLLNFSLIGVLAASAAGYQVELSGTLMTVYASSIALANLWAFGSQAASKLGDMMGGPSQ